MKSLYHLLLCLDLILRKKKQLFLILIKVNLEFKLKVQILKILLKGIFNLI